MLMDFLELERLIKRSSSSVRSTAEVHSEVELRTFDCLTKVSATPDYSVDHTNSYS